MDLITRRQALANLLAVPLAARLAAQSRAGKNRRVVLGNGDGMLLLPNGTLQMWVRKPSSDTEAPSSLGLGDNRALKPFTLVTVPGISGVIAASAGWNCSFVVLGDGRLLAWGKNPNGRLGTTTQEQMETLASWAPNESNKPIPLSTRFDAVDVSAGDDHALALTRDGSVYAWGVGRAGQLGIGPMPIIQFKTRTPASMPFMPVPVRVPDLGNVVAISAGGLHSLALLKDGTVRAWGNNRDGEIGDGTSVNRDRPTIVPGVREAVAIAAGPIRSLALLANGTVMFWGAKDQNGGVGVAPALVPGVKGIKAIAIGLGHGVALTDAGTVMTWGDNSHSQLGRGRNSPEAPGVVPMLSAVESIACRHETTTAVLSTGRIMTFGEVREYRRDGLPSNLSAAPMPLSVDGLENP